MANPRKKTIQLWDGGIKTSNRDNNPDTSDGAQIIKGFDIYKDANKLIPMQSWTDFTLESEKALGIRAMGGVSDTVFGLGKAMSNWYAKEFPYRIKISASQAKFSSASTPLHVDMSLLPSDFWNNVSEDMTDIRVTDKNNTIYGAYTENVDYVGQTGDLWIKKESLSEVNSPALSLDFTPTANATQTIDNTTGGGGGVGHAIFFQVELYGESVNYLKIKGLHSTLTNSTTLGTMTAYLYDNNAGVPGSLVATLGSYNADYITQITTGDFREFIFNSFSYTGTYHIVIKCTGASSSNTCKLRYLNTGIYTVGVANNSVLSAWTSTDTSATVGFSMGYVDTENAHFYLYYGNTEPEALPSANTAFAYQNALNEPFRNGSFDFAYNFGDNDLGNYTEGFGQDFTTTPFQITDGLVGQAVNTNNLGYIQTDTDDEVALTGSDIAISLVFKVEGSGSINVNELNGNWTMTASPSGGLDIFIDGTSVNVTETSSEPIISGKWYVVDLNFNSNTTLAVNGMVQDFGTAGGSFDGDAAGNALRISTSPNCYVGLVWGWNNDIHSDAGSKTKLFNFTESDFWTIGSQETQDDVNIQYSGTQLYQKSIESGNWESVYINGRPVRTLTFDPMNSYVDDSGTYFALIQNTSLYIAEKNSLDILDPNHLNLGVLVESPHIASQPETAINATMYQNVNYNTVGTNTDDIVFTVPSGIESMSAWRTYLAVAYTYRNKGYVHIWDLVADGQATEKILTGTGRCRIVGNASDTLFAVVDNYIDDAVRSNSKPTMEIKQYVGNGRMETTHVIEIPVNIDDSTYADYWDLAVTNFKITRNTQTLFYARLPKDETGTTFNEGFWSVGKNSRGQLSLALQIDTEGLGMPENVFSFGQQVFFIAKDGGIHRLSADTYNNVALFTTLKMNEGNTQIEKKLIGVEIVTEPLIDGQTVSVYFKKDGDTTRTKIFDLTGEGEFAYEQTYDINEDSLPTYKEIEFDIESTGGKAGILEFNYRYEYLKDIV